MTTRSEFLNALAERLAELPEGQREELTERITGMLDDRIEMGMAEDAAVAALGDIDALIRDAAPGASALPAPASPEHCRGAIREIQLHLKNADGRIVRGTLPEGASAQIEASTENLFTWSLSEGALVVREVGEVRRALFRQSQRLTITLADCRPDRLIADSYGGDLRLEGVEAGELMVLSVSSGDIKARSIACGGRAELTARSGDLTLNDVRTTGDLKLECVSGDIELNRVEAGSLRARTASGDIDGSRVAAGAISLGATSGDVELKHVQAAEALACETTSGDIELDRVAAPELRLATASGDVSVALPAGPCDIQASSTSGSVRLPDNIPGGENPMKVTVYTKSGDIKVVMD